MKRPIEHEYKSFVSYARELEKYCDWQSSALAESEKDYEDAGQVVGNFEVALKKADAELATLRTALVERYAEIERLRGYLRKSHGYAAGNYMNKCLHCDTQMEWVDKRCYVCADCADKSIDAALKETK